MKVISIANIAGGTGKTTSAANLACGLAKRGKRVLIVDMDPQANATSYLGTRAESGVADALIDPDAFPSCIGPSRAHGVDVAHGSLDTAGAEVMLAAKPGGSSLRLKKCLRTVDGRYDYVIIDCPPAPGLLTYNAIVACTEIIVPVETKPKALEGVRIMKKVLSGITDDIDLMPNGSPGVRYLATRFDGRTTLDRDCLSTLRADPDFKTFGTVIRINQKLPESYAARQSIMDYDPKSNGALDYLALVAEFLEDAAHGS